MSDPSQDTVQGTPARVQRGPNATGSHGAPPLRTRSRFRVNAPAGHRAVVQPPAEEDSLMTATARVRHRTCVLMPPELPGDGSGRRTGGGEPLRRKGQPGHDDPALAQRIGHTLSPTRLPLPALTGVAATSSDADPGGLVAVRPERSSARVQRTGTDRHDHSGRSAGSASRRRASRPAPARTPPSVPRAGPCTSRCGARSPCCDPPAPSSTRRCRRPGTATGPRTSPRAPADGRARPPSPRPAAAYLRDSARDARFGMPDASGSTRKRVLLPTRCRRRNCTDRRQPSQCPRHSATWRRPRPANCPEPQAVALVHQRVPVPPLVRADRTHLHLPHDRFALVASRQHAARCTPAAAEKPVPFVPILQLPPSG